MIVLRNHDGSLIIRGLSGEVLGNKGSQILRHNKKKNAAIIARMNNPTDKLSKCKFPGGMKYGD